MNNQQQIVELAKAMRDSEWLCSFRTQETRQLAALAAGLISEDVDRLLDLIDPQPVGVDWGKVIQTRHGWPAKWLYRINKECLWPNVVVVTEPSGIENMNMVSDEGLFNDPRCKDSEFDIINVPDPAPIELRYEVAVATLSCGDKALAIQFGECQTLVISRKGEVFYTEDADCPDFEAPAWQTRTVTG